MHVHACLYACMCACVSIFPSQDFTMVKVTFYSDTGIFLSGSLSCKGNNPSLIKEA